MELHSPPPRSLQVAYWSAVGAAVLMVLSGCMLFASTLHSEQQRPLIALASVLGGLLLAAVISQVRHRVGRSLVLLLRGLIALNLLAIVLGSSVSERLLIVVLLGVSAIALRHPDSLTYPNNDANDDTYQEFRA